MLKEISKTRTQLAKKLGLTGNVKPGGLMERRELINTGKLAMPKKPHLDRLSLAERHLSLAERHLNNYHK